MSESTIISEGACVRLTRDIEQPYGGRPLRKGDEFTVEEFNPAMPADDPRRQDPEYIHEAFYDGHDDRHGSVSAWADGVEVVRTAEQQNNRRLPSLKDLGSFIGGELLTEGDGFTLDESDFRGIEKDHQVELYGETDEGLRFALVLQVVSLIEVDL